MFGNGKKTVNSEPDGKSQFLEQTKSAREERAHKQLQVTAAIIIQVRFPFFNFL